MKKRIIQVEDLSADYLIDKLEALSSEIKELKEAFKPQFQARYLTRQEVADLFKVSLVTIHDWTNKGILTKHRIGNKVRYKQNEIEQALREVKK
jgi:excisionase family DNA binding protein